MNNFKNHKKSYIVAAVVLIALIFGGLSYSGFDFSKLTGSMTGGGTTLPPILSPQTMLSISVISTPESSILIAGSTQQIVSGYSLKALNGDVRVNKLTVINDLSGAFDSPVNTNAVAQVVLIYPSSNFAVAGSAIAGSTITKTGILTNGMVTFSDLNLVIPKNTSKNLQIYANISPMSQSLSGSNFRLGIKDSQNTAATFEAVGVTSNKVINPSFVGASFIQSFVVRKSKPTFISTPGSTVLHNGENTLYSFNVTADSAGPISFGRFVYDVTVNGFDRPGADISQWSLYRGNTIIPATDVSINCTDSSGSNATKLQSLATGSTLGLCDGIKDNGIVNGTYSVIVSFNKEEKVPSGVLGVSYSLKANVNSIIIGNMVATKFNAGDDSVQLAGLTANKNPNMGKIYVGGDTTNGIFTVFPAQFSQLPTSARNIIWSDNSADILHTYPTISAGTVTSGTGSGDWTNGYLLKMGTWPSITLIY